MDEPKLGFKWTPGGEVHLYLPPRCPECGESLDRVDHKEDSAYDFNPVTGLYEEVLGGRGSAVDSCLSCGHQLNQDEDGPFDNGAGNFCSEDGRTCATCTHIGRDEDGLPLWDEELQQYNCFAKGGFNGEANWIHMSRDHQECDSWNLYTVVAPGQQENNNEA